MVASSCQCCQKSHFSPSRLLTLGEYAHLSTHTLEGLEHYHCNKLKA